MRLVIQRVTRASVSVAGEVMGAIATGLLVFVAVAKTDTTAQADALVAKLAHLRIFPDTAGKMNLNLIQAGGGLLLISQFTLLANCQKGNRPSFDSAAGLAQAQELYNYFVSRARQLPVRVAEGRFQAHMDVELCNHGPVTIVLDSPAA